MKNESRSTGTNNELNGVGQIFRQSFGNFWDQAQILKTLKTKLKLYRSFIFIWTTLLTGMEEG